MSDSSEAMTIEAMTMDPYQIDVMFLGDSIVAGYPTASGFRGFVQKALEGRPFRFVGPFLDDDGLAHAGFHGFSLADILKKLDVLLSYRPDILIVSAGGNGMPDTPPKDVGRQMATLARAFLKNGTRSIYVCTLPDVRNYSETIAAYNAAIRTAVRRLPQVHLIDCGSVPGPAMKDSPLWADDAHPSRLGYQKMSEPLLQKAFHVKAAVGNVEGKKSVPELVRRAKEALDNAYPNLHPRVALWALSVGLLTRYGVEEPWTYGGEPSHNWGAVHYTDKRHSGYYRVMPEGPLYAKFATPEEGAIAIVEERLTDPVLKAVHQGSNLDVASAMGENELYGKALDEAEKVVFHALGMSETAPTKASTGADSTTSAANSTASTAEPSPSPFSVGNVGVLLITLGIFGATLSLVKRKAP